MDNDFIHINIELDQIPPPDKLEPIIDPECTQVRYRFIIQLLSTLGIIGFCTYSIASTGELPDKDNLVYSMLSSSIFLWIPPPKVKYIK